MERRLRERAQLLLAQDEEVLSAIVVLTGPLPGVEGLLAGLAGPLGGLLSIVGVGGVLRSRTYYTIAITTRGVVQFKNRTLRRPSAIVARSDDLSALGPFNETTGDFWVEFSGTRYWMEGLWTFESHRMQKIIASRSHG